jgi:subtilisin
MSARALRIAVVSAALVAASASAQAGTAAAATPSTSSYVVVYQDSVIDVDAVTNQLQASLGITSKLRYRSAVEGFAANLTSTQVSALSTNPNVAFVQADSTFKAAGLASVAAGETVPPGIRRVGAATTTQAHQASNANVAVLDSGIDLPNTDLNAVSGTNCVKTGNTAQDDNGHGTHVAGIVAAKNSGSNLVGVAPGTKLYAVKVLGSNASGTLSQILCGIDWVTANAASLNIKVANMSIVGAGSNDNNCGNTNSDSEHKAICRSVAAGVTYVAAAGNTGANFANTIPAAYPELLTATAMSDTDGVAGGTGAVPSCKKGEKDDSYGTYSNYAVGTTEQNHAVAAPGTCVVSDKRGGGVVTYYGTSQSAPHVAGAVALCLGNGGGTGPCSGLTPAQIVQKIRNDAAAGATASNGFAGDPLRPVTGKYFGYLLRAAGY